VSSRESWLLLVFPRHSALTVGFGFAAAANPIILDGGVFYDGTSERDLVWRAAGHPLCGAVTRWAAGAAAGRALATGPRRLVPSQGVRWRRGVTYPMALVHRIGSRAAVDRVVHGD
jgi:hypothetical protein